MKYLIVPIDDEHIAGFNAAVGSVARERRFLAFLDTPPLAQSEAFVRRVRAAGFPQFVAICERHVVGWCDIAPMDRPVFTHAGVLGIGVVTEFRGKGIGTALMRTTIAQAQKIGLTRIELTVRANNRVARALYEKLGFTQEGILRNAVRIDDAYADLHVMALLLDEKSIAEKGMVAQP